MSTKPRSQQSPGGDRPTITLTLPSGWGRAGAAGFLAAFTGWAIPVAVAMVSFWLVADSPWLRQATWQDAAGIGSSFWALSLGSSAQLGELTVRALPGLWTLIQLLMLRVFLGRMRRFTPASVWAAVPAFTALSVALAMPLADGVIWWELAIGAGIVSGVGSLWAYWGVVRLPGRWAQRIRPVTMGVFLSLGYLLVVNLIGFVTLVARTVVSFDRVSAAAGALQGPGGAQAILWILQISFLPLGAAWAVSWLGGTGIIGVDGELITAQHPATQPLPFPVWQLLPTGEAASYQWIFIIVSLLLAGLFWVLLRRQSLPFAVATLVIGTVVGTLLVAAWMALSQVSLGTGALRLLGPETWVATGRITLLLMLIPLVVPLLFHPRTVQAVRALLDSEVATDRSEPAPELQDHQEEPADPAAPAEPELSAAAEEEPPSDQEVPAEPTTVAESAPTATVSTASAPTATDPTGTPARWLKVTEAPSTLEEDPNQEEAEHD